jgi:hypothetical protein
MLSVAMSKMILKSASLTPLVDSSHISSPPFF